MPSQALPSTESLNQFRSCRPRPAFSDLPRRTCDRCPCVLAITPISRSSHCFAVASSSCKFRVSSSGLSKIWGATSRRCKASPKLRPGECAGGIAGDIRIEPLGEVTLDGHVPGHRALRLLRREHPAWRRVKVRNSKYLNNIIEQDHRAIRRRCASMKGFESFANAAVTIAGVELAHRIHKHQFSLGRGRPRHYRSLRTTGNVPLHENRLAGREISSAACAARRCTGTPTLFSGDDSSIVSNMWRTLPGPHCKRQDRCACGIMDVTL